MKTGRTGHWFCDTCDEVAYDRICRGCRGYARFVPDEPPRAERGAELFDKMRAAVETATPEGDGSNL
jgi:hypothetical protein